MNGRSFFRAATFFAFLILSSGVLLAQGGGNSVTGHVFGVDRRPVYDANVELLDEFSRTLQRTRTDSSGRYYFAGFGPGNYIVRVLPYETDYEAAEESFQIINPIRTNNSGEQRYAGFHSERRDFHLRVRRGALGVTGAVFVQEIPPEAKKLYEQAIQDLNDKRETDGIRNLKAAVEAFPKYYMALSRLGEEYVRLKHYEAARILLALAVEVNPRGYRSWYGLAYSLNALQLPQEALVAAEKAVEIYAGSAEAMLLTGVLLRANKKYPEAEKRLLTAKELAKNSIPDIHWHLALLYGNDLKRYDAAARELKLFLKAKPNSPDTEKIKQLIATFEEKARTKS